MRVLPLPGVRIRKSNHGDISPYHYTCGIVTANLRELGHDDRELWPSGFGGQLPRQCSECRHRPADAGGKECR